MVKKKNVSEIARGEAEQPKPSGDQFPPNRYRVHVSYAKLPVMEELEKRFSGKDNVSSLFDGRPWERHSSCAKIDETPGEREFFVASVPKQFFSQRIDTIRDALAAHFGGLGYRFAIETEAVTFADAQPGLPHQNWIYALGSSARSGGGRQFVAVLSASVRGRFLSGYWLDNGLNSGDRLLLVRKCL